MTPELWNRLKPLFDAAVEKTPEDRQAFLATLDADEEVRRELRQLVRAYESSATTDDSLPARMQSIMPAVAMLRPGDVLRNQFRIVRWLGRGGMGDVYEALDLETQECVALKLIRSDIASHPGIMARFQKEVQLAHRISGPNICRIHAFYHAEESPAGITAFLTMELLDGVTLADEINNHGPLPWARAFEIVQDLCEGLAAMHREGIIHRDLKTRNVMLANRNGAIRAVLMDFGLAREVAVTGTESETGVTAPGLLVGTPACMAPEQFSGGHLSPATDIYAMGVVLYEMLTGREPYSSSDPVRAAISRARTPERPSTLRARLPQRCDRVIFRCLQFDPLRRYQSAEELARDWKRCCTLFARVASRAVRQPVLWSAAALILLTIAGFGTWKWLHHASDVDLERARGWYAQGLAALREGTYLKAAGEFQQAISTDDGLAVAHAGLAEAWAELDFTGAAEHEMLLATERERNSGVPARDRKYIDAVRVSLTHDYPEAVRRQQAILNSLPGSDKGYGYLDLARAQEKNNDLAGAVKSYEQAARLSPDNPAPYVHLGILKSRQQDAPDAEAAFRRAEELYRVRQNIEGLGEVDFQRAHWANERSETGAALMWIDKCLQIARQIPSVQLEVRALSQLSNVGYYSGQDDKAIADAAREIDLARENHLEYWVTDGLIRQGNAYLSKDLASAEKVTLEALQRAEKDQHGHLAANARETMASIRDQQGRLDDQIQYAQAALTFFDAWGFQSQAFEVGVLLQRAQLGKGDLDQSLSSATKLLELAKKINSPGRMAMAEEAMGGVSLEMQQYPDALLHFNEALRFSRIAHQDVSYQRVHSADVLWRLGRYSEAEAMLSSIPAEDSAVQGIGKDVVRIRASILLTQRRYNQALKMADDARHALRDLTSADLVNLGYITTLSELETGRVEDARMQVQKLEQVVQDEGLDGPAAEVHYLLALVDLRTNNPAVAVQEAQAALAYFAARHQVEWIWRLYACMTEAYKSQGSSADAAQSRQKALDTLNGMQQTWGTSAFQEYRSRPDIHVAISRLGG